MFSRILKYLFVATFMFLFAVLYNERFTFVLFSAVLLFPIFLYVTLMMVKRTIKLEVKVKNPIFKKGEKAEVLITVQNQIIFPISQADIYICYYHGLTNKKHKDKVYASMLGKSQQELSVELSSEHCGMIIFYLNYIRIYDFIKLFSTRIKLNQRIELMVEPNVLELLTQEVPQNPYVYVDQDLNMQNKKGDDPSEIFAIREYQEGDKLHRIHWKLSYKQQMLMVKEYVNPLCSSVALLLELNYTSKEEQLHCMDSLLEFLVSIANWYVEQKAPLVVFWYNLEQEQLCQMRITSKESIYELLSILFTVKLYEAPEKVISQFIHMKPLNEFTHILYLSYLINIEEVKQLGIHFSQSYVYLVQLLNIVDASKRESSEMKVSMIDNMYAMSLNSYNLKQDLLLFQERYLRGDEYDFK